MTMDKIDCRSITLTTLSPIHIGSDEDYVPTNFVIKDNLLHYLDMAVLADVLDDNERRELNARQTIGAIQQFFKSRRDRFAPLASHIIGVASDIAQEYEVKAGQPVQRGVGGELTYNMFPITRTAYRTIDFSPYLPGSSLKGSIRTAWLDALNSGKPLQQIAGKGKETNQALQQRLLGYTAGKFENDSLRHLHLADAHHDDEPMPTHILYAVSKKKRPGERNASELKVFLETIPGLLSDAFTGEIRIKDENSLTWQQLCDACNAFYWPQLEAELEHAHLADMLDATWQQTMQDLLNNEFDELGKNHQGFLLRVGKHSGAESVTLNGVRDIKILGKKGSPPTYHRETTEKRFASESREAASGLLPFGWLWVESCQDEYQYLSIAVRDKLRPYTDTLRDAQRERLEQVKQARATWQTAKQAAEQKRIEEEEATRREAEAAQAKAAELASMSENMRQIARLRDEIDKRLAMGRKINVSDQFYGGTMKKLAQQALESLDWSTEEKSALANMLEDRAGKLMNLDAKDLRKQLKLTALRGQA
ncbi:type III-A CRISPR-associated RAMP protein Csm5 [Nitrosomonas sp. Nm132]|uniref:type III-A CRISPR-associated RAMP protein Csm5 n=1 Tax=Nitrosomonas sp. Nm132 TaxID=1881053 RepID=UPI0008857A44|nr:type III-A CRISPR-associated RAMP protein Csm5 [Nitrosomonas sp. Nm132]SDH35886.1 CRISPR-associated protein Csm5 [Nitrosomonas sp. Nm132]